MTRRAPCPLCPDNKEYSNLRLHLHNAHKVATIVKFSDGRTSFVERDPVINLFYCPRCPEAYKSLQNLNKHVKVCSGAAVQRSPSQASHHSSRVDQPPQGRAVARPGNTSQNGAFDVTLRYRNPSHADSGSDTEPERETTRSALPPQAGPSRRYATAPPNIAQQPHAPANALPRNHGADASSVYGPLFLPRRFLSSAGYAHHSRVTSQAGSSRTHQPPRRDQHPPSLPRRAQHPPSLPRRSATVHPPGRPPVVPPPAVYPVPPVPPMVQPTPNTPWSVNSFMRSIINDTAMSNLADALESTGARTADHLLIISGWDEVDRRWDELLNAVTQSMASRSQPGPQQTATQAELKPLHWWAFQKTIVRHKEELRRLAACPSSPVSTSGLQCPGSRFLGRLGLCTQRRVSVLRDIGMDSEEVLDFVCQLSDEDSIKFEKEFLMDKFSWFERMLIADGLRKRRRGKQRAQPQDPGT